MNTKPPEDHTPPEGNPLEHSGTPQGDLPAEASSADGFDPETDELLSAYLDSEATEQEVRQIEADPELLGRVAQLRAASQQVAGPVFERQRTEIIAAAMTEYDQLYKTTRRTGAAEADSEDSATSSHSSLGNKKSVFFNDAGDTEKSSFWRSPARSRVLGLAALLVAGLVGYGMLRLVDNSAGDDQLDQSSAVAASVAVSSMPDLADLESATAAPDADDSIAAAESWPASTTVAAATTTTIYQVLDGVEVPAISSSSNEAGETTEIIIPPASLPQTGSDCDNYDGSAGPEPPTTSPPATTVAETVPDSDPDATSTTVPSTTVPTDNTATTGPTTTVLEGADHPNPPALPDADSSGPPAANANFGC